MIRERDQDQDFDFCLRRAWRPRPWSPGLHHWHKGSTHYTWLVHHFQREKFRGSRHRTYCGNLPNTLF